MNEKILYIPDPIFKNYLLNHKLINRNGNDEILLSEAKDFDGVINCSNLDISDLTGIESFSQVIKIIFNNTKVKTIDTSKNKFLLGLGCSNTLIENLDFSKNKDLRDVNCSDNNIKNIDINKNPAIQLFHCEGTLITNLDTSHNLKLQYLECSHTFIETIDLSNNPELDYFWCLHTPLKSLDISNNVKLKILECDNTPELSCIKVDTCHFKTLKKQDKRFSLSCK